MKFIYPMIISLCLAGCSLFGTGQKRAPEVVASCFSDGENQATICKTQRVNEQNRVVTTRCIGTKNQEAKPHLRGKCVEKICAENSNTDCQVRGEMAVLEQYAELTTANMFASDESAPKGAQGGKKTNITKSGNSKSKVKPAPSPSPTPESTPVAKKNVEAQEATTASTAPAEKPESMNIVLKPAAKGRAPAQAEEDNTFKKVCVAKGDTSYAEYLRGKCATRTCAKGKCSYQGRKEIFSRWE